MINAQLTNIVIASLKAAGITPPELSPIRPFPKPRARTGELTELIINSDYEDPYDDPKVIAHSSRLYIQSLGSLDAGHHQRELERRAVELDSHKDSILEQLQEAFNATAKRLIKHSETLTGIEDLATIDPRIGNRATAMAATNSMQDLMALEDILKAWRDLWAALGRNSYGVERGKPFTFMNPNAQTWDDLQHNPTIWAAVRSGVDLTLADSPAHVGQRYQAMINKQQAALDAMREAHHQKNGAAMLKAYQS